MNKQLIAKTAVCYLDSEYEEYVVESPLLNGCAGIGDTEEEAHRIFSRLLDDAYEAYLEGRVPDYDRPGRPSKGRIPLNLDVKPETKEAIKELAKSYKCSQGEIVDYLYFLHWATQESQKAKSSLRESDQLVTASVSLTPAQIKQLLKNIDSTNKPKRRSSPTRKARTA